MRLDNEELLELTRKAFENDEVAEFLCGENGYSVDGSRDIPAVPADIPTDFGRIVESGIFKLYGLTKDEAVISKTKSALLKLISGTPVRVWCAFMIVRRQISKYENGRAPFEIADAETVLALRKALCVNETELRRLKIFLGANCENCLWQDILRVDENYKEAMGVGVL